MHPQSPSLRSLKYFLQIVPQILGLKKTDLFSEIYNVVM